MFSSDHFPTRHRVTVRELACGWVHRSERVLLAVGLLGMFGFTAASWAVARGWFEVPGYVIAVIPFLAGYAAALLIFHLGDPRGLPGQPPGDEASSRASAGAAEGRALAHACETDSAPLDRTPSLRLVRPVRHS